MRGKLNELAVLQIAEEIAKKGPVQDHHTPANLWHFHKSRTIWCGNESTPQPPLLSSRVDPITLEESIMVAPLNQVLRPVKEKQSYNSDEKPLVLNTLARTNIIFRDEFLSGVPDAIPWVERCKNVTLLITSRGDGRLYTRVIFAGVPGKFDPFLDEVLSKFDFSSFNLFTLSTL